MFGKLFNKAIKSFDQVKLMVTREVPIPEDDEEGQFIQFIAKKNEMGWWSITSRHTKTTAESLDILNTVYRQALHKHSGRELELLRGDLLMTFETAFMVLRDLEDSLLGYKNTDGGREPDRHFMAAYRLLGDGEKAVIDNTYFTRNREKGAILAPYQPKKPPSAPKGRLGRN